MCSIRSLITDRFHPILECRTSDIATQKPNELLGTEDSLVAESLQAPGGVTPVLYLPELTGLIDQGMVPVRTSLRQEI